MNTINPFELIDQKLNRIQADLDKLNSRPEPETPALEKYVTTDQVCEKWNISRVTLWSWDKKGLTNPLRIGNLKRYRLSEIESLGKTRDEQSGTS